MRNRRNNNEGSIYQNDKSYWVAQLQIGIDEDGKRKFKKFTSKDKNKVLTKLNELKYQLAHNIINNDVTKKVTFKESLDYFLANKQNKIKNTTFQSYKYLSDKYIRPYFDKQDVKKIQAITIQNFYNDLFLVKKLSASTIKKIHTILQQVFKKLDFAGTIIKNPCSAVDLPQARKTRIDDYILTEKELKLLLANSKDRYLYYVILLAIYTGCRKGELLALKWKNFDFNNKCIKIESNLVYISKTNNSTGHMQEQSPKTNQSYRIIHIPDKVVNEFKIYYEYKTNFKEENDFVFCAQQSGKGLDSHNVNHVFKKILKKCDFGKNIRFHDLRHTHCSLLLSKDIPLVDVSHRMGHSSITTTAIYSHAYLDNDKKIKNKLEQLIL